jgi:hypothetical protein
MAQSIGRFVPFTGREHLPGRRTSNATSRDALAARIVGRTRLEVYAVLDAHGKDGKTQASIAYSVVAIGNVSREARTLAKLSTLDQAERYLAAYSPRYGLLK